MSHRPLNRSDQQRELRPPRRPFLLLGAFVTLAAVCVTGAWAQPDLAAVEPRAWFTSGAPVTGETIALAAGRNAPRLLVSASLMGWSLFSPEYSGDPLFVVPDGEFRARHEGLDTAGSAAAMLTMATLGAGSISRDFDATVDRLSIVTSVIATSYAARTYLKAAFQRTRPYAVGTTPDPMTDPDALRSFPSGHSLLAWACVGDAIVTTAKGTSRSWLLPVLAIEATTVSVLRVAAGEHHVGDVLAGALIGIATGSLVSLISR